MLFDFLLHIYLVVNTSEWPVTGGLHPLTHRVRLHLAMSLLHLLCNQKLHRRLVQPIGLVDRLSVFKKVHLTISSFLKAVFEAVDR